MQRTFEYPPQPPTYGVGGVSQVSANKYVQDSPSFLQQFSRNLPPLLPGALSTMVNLVQLLDH